MSLNQNKAEELIRTTMIGAIAKIEKVFGPFWGHGKEPDERTEKQDRIYKLFLNLREQILDHGNEQIRKLRERKNGSN